MLRSLCRLLGGAAVLAALAPASPARADGPAWPGGILRYEERLAPSDHWALRQAVRAWNRSGADVRLRRATPVAPAGAVVGYRAVPATGLGTASVGFSPSRQGFVHILAPGERDRRHDRYLIAVLLAHELGHVLGLDHGPTCTLMAPDLTAWAGGTAGCRKADPQAWRCLMLSRADVRRLTALYGGQARRMPAQRWCRRR